MRSDGWDIPIGLLPSHVITVPNWVNGRDSHGVGLTFGALVVSLPFELLKWTDIKNSKMLALILTPAQSALASYLLFFESFSRSH